MKQSALLSAEMADKQKVQKTTKQGTLITSNLHVSPDEDDSPHTALDSYTDKPLATTNSNEYDASCTTDNISHSDVSSYTNTIIQQNCIEVSYAYINCRHCSYFL